MVNLYHHYKKHKQIYQSIIKLDQIRKMKKSKSTTIVKRKQPSLPKIQSRLLNGLNLNQFERLQFPRRDDSSLVAGVGRRHFQANDSDSITRVMTINSQVRYDQPYQLVHKNTKPSVSPYKLFKINNEQYTKALEQKLYIGDGYLKTQRNQPPYARDYLSQRPRKQKTQVNEYQQELRNVKQHHKLKTELNTMDIDRNKYSSKIVTVKNLQEQNNKVFSPSSPDILEAKSMSNHYYSLNRNPQENKDRVISNIAELKVGSTPGSLEYVNKRNMRMYNPTFISSNF